MIRFAFLSAFMMAALCVHAQEKPKEETDPMKRRVASIYFSETFINEQLAEHLSKSQLVKNLKVDFDPDSDKMFLRGLLALPIDDFRAMGIDPSMAEFKFQLTVKPRISRRGHLVLEFPLSETFFYQASSKHPERDRVVIPVQLLSLGLAATRGYLAALSGDFSTFDRKSAKINALLRGIRRSISEEKNEDALAALKNEKKSLELQLEATALERERFERTSKTLTNLMGFTGEKEFNLNNEIKAKDNAIMLKIRLGNLVPYLKNTELGGIRITHNKKDGNGEDYFIIDVNSLLAELPTPAEKTPRAPRTGLKVAPALLIRMNQAIFDSKAIVDAEKEKMGDDIRDFDVSFKDDGIHVSGKVKKWIFHVPFDSTVDFVATQTDTFEVRLRQLHVWGMSLKFLTKYALTAMEKRLEKVLHGICTYEYLGDVDGSKALQVKIDPKKLIPAFPDMHLVDIDVRDRNFVLRIGRAE